MLFEYKTERLSPFTTIEDRDEILNALGQKGWQVCGVYGDRHEILYTLKREL